MKQSCCLLYAILICEFLLACSQTPQVYSQEPIPDPFTQGMRYPNREEDEECRPIKLRVRRNSVRFSATIIRNSNNFIRYEIDDARYMTSRMKSRIDVLASWYRSTYGQQLRILISYVDGNVPGGDSSLRSNSLHYEGRSARIRGITRSHLSAIARQAILSGFDWVYYANRDYCVVSVIPDVCQTDLDLLFLLDESGSVGSQNYQLAIQFMQSVVSFFDVEANRTRIGMIAFSTGARVEFLFGDYLTNQAVHTAIGRTRYSGGYTHTAYALYYATLSYLDRNLAISGARPVSAGVPRVVVLITDGRSNHYRVDDQAEQLRSHGVTVYSVGIANYDINELSLIASDPDVDHVFLLRSYTDAASFVQLLSGTTCDTPANLPPGNETDNEVEEDDFRYYQIECPAFTDTVIIEQIDIVGHCAVYVSVTIVNPGPLNPVAVTARNENPSVNRRRVTFTLGSIRIIYISIRGITAIRNRFRMVVWNMLFAEDVYSVTVPNGVLDGNSILDLNVMNANDANYYFNITEGNEDRKFRIGSNNGQIYLNEALNAQIQDFYNLTVVAYLRSNDCQRGRTYVEVYVSAANQHSPVFQSTSSVSVLETAVIGSSVVRVTATDADFGVNGEVRYSITGGNNGNAFAIDSVTGDISVAGALNHTLVPSYTLTLTATDQASNNPRTDITTQLINIEDVNQNPFFLTGCAITGLCRYTVSEAMSLNVVLNTISAGDPDTSSRGQLDFVLDPTNTPFSISSTGQISLVAVLDRETLDTYRLNLTVSDRGSPSLAIYTAITYTVTDVNDNAPILTIPSQVRISEGAFVGDGILQAAATDTDIGVNAQVTYTLHTGTSLFTIDSSTGAVTLAGSLDYETMTEHSIVISASNPDGLSSSRETSTVVVINENDNSPVFTMAQYIASIPEGSSSGTSVVTVQASDADTGALGQVQYSITRGNSNGNFAIDSTSGLITVNGIIDRETISEYTLVVRAQDGGNPARSDRSTVVITVTDINDNTPVFQRSVYAITVREDARVPSNLLTVLATDADEAGSQNSAITYSIESGNAGGIFSLTASTGELSLAQSLDFESVTSYSLNIAATDGGSLTGVTVVMVTVTNVNDEVPVLSSDQTISISENTTTPSEVATFTATGEIGEVLQFRLSGDQNGEFVINMNTGVVSLVQPVDYEERQEYTLTVTVSDGQFSSSSGLNIRVTDENDNAPVIEPAGPFTIPEQRPTNTFIGSVRASDRDSGTNGQFSFQIGQPITLFTLVPNGNSVVEIRTAAVLDREELVQMNQFLPPNSQVTITIEVTDNGSPSLTARLDVVIRLQDINDNDPILVNPVQEVSIPESSNIGSSITQLVATDEDIGVNAQVSFSLRGSSLFVIDSSTGTITLASSLDYETETQHMVMVTASNPDGRRSIEHTITIVVIDENDNSPIFTMDPYTASVTEHSSIGTTVETVLANDADSGLLGQVRYSIASGNIGAAFNIDEVTGLITVNVNNIDRELISAYTLTISANNPGTLSRMSTSRVDITVTDINDNSPLFSQSEYTLSIREDASLSPILTVIVTDADQSGSVNSQFDITISSGNEDGLFTISSPSGILSLSSSLDYEMQTSHELNLTATDRGNPVLSSTAVIQITVINVNDNPPVISGDQTVQLNESAEVGSDVTDFTATSEQGETLRFSIMPNTLLTINSQTGAVTLAQNLDYEFQQSFTAQVSVSDGLFASSATLTVNVLDENDNAPQISPAGPFAIAEEIAAGTVVGTMSASDSDSVSMTLTFSFLDTNALTFFNINPSNGEIRTASILDREALADQFIPPSSSRTFTISVSDGQLSSTTNVTFQLLDINDNDPILANLMSLYDINENSAIGVEVFTVTATDADLGSNAVVSYSISSSPFTVDRSTGSVAVAGSLDYEVATSHSVTVTASDGTRSSSQAVTINVIDVNDNAPIFSMNSYTGQADEHSSINTTVTTAVSAIDADSGAFGTVRYSLEGDNGVFRVDPASGDVVVNQDIDREVITQFTFTVVATDSGNPAMSASSSIVVSISDINDNSPVFQQSSYTVRVREDAAISTEVLTVLATDADEMGNLNSQIDYSFQTSSSVFSISERGVIILTSSLDFEAISSYALVAVATDRGSPMMSGVSNISIVVVNVNDQPPVLSGDQSITLSELTAVSDQIAQFNATSDAGGALMYQLGGAQNGEFAIDVSTGIVTLVRSLDYETTQFYTLTVTASDSQFSTTTAFNITVTDENDNSPRFEAVDVLEITEEQAVGTRVGQVIATDADSGENAAIRYSFVQSSTQNYFSVDEITGEISTANTLDRELLVQENLFLPPTSQITFQVQATDMGNPPLFSQVDVIVQLNDINDNPPRFANSDRRVMVEENAPLGQDVATVTASDADLGNNARISFTLSGSPFFTINGSTGVVSLAQMLDYEMSPQHEIAISASNPDGLVSVPSYFNITVIVVDVNDNSPIFTMDPYTASVTEHSSIGTSVVTVLANDADSGLLGQVRYSIVDDVRAFTINETSGLISVSSDIDRENDDSYTFVVQASDSGTTARSAVSTVIITVADINDNTPVFDQSLYQYNISEDTSVPTQLFAVSATDSDLSVNSVISYSINDGFGLFDINSVTGSFNVTSSLDFETRSSYSIGVRASDSGEPSLTGTAMIMINVINVNDQAPQLSGDQLIELSELTTTMSRVTQFTASGEESETLTFSLVGDGAGSVFAIDPTTGIVSLLASLDFETTNFYGYTVTVSDGMFTSSSSLNVSVLDENDNAPEFTSSDAIRFEEERPANTVIGQVIATDADSGINSELSYSFTQSRANTFFNINLTSGEVSTAVQLDREGLAAMNVLIEQFQFIFDVQASDRGNPVQFSTQTITFELTDINDNAPEFVNPPTTISISESASTGDVVTDLSAVDPDLGQNAIISYSVTGSTQFTINATTGVVTLASSLDYETETQHTIMVTASNPDGLRSAVHNITIVVIDENDNSPIFTMDPYTAPVTEHSSIGTSVVTVLADDADSGVLGEVSYSITSGNTGEAFTINNTNGLLSVNSDIDRETLEAYIVGVTAVDGGGRSVQTTVEVIVMDINDNSPVFNPPSYSGVLHENASINSTVISVATTDVDEDGPNSDVSYSIQSGNDGNLFRISSSGVISVMSSLDFETASSHQLVIQAMDGGSPSLSASAVVTVRVLDVNDESPTLGGNQVVNVSELATVNSRITQFEVSNPEQSDVISFALSGDQAEDFALNSSTGVVTLAQSLDHETTLSYVLIITVNDGVFTSSAQLTVNVLDENDNQPEFVSNGPFEVTEEMPVNSTVGQVVGMDRDSGLNGQIQFSINRNIGDDLFSIDASTGMIRTTGVLDREALVNLNLFTPPGSQQVLVVQAEDNGSPSSFSQADVTIQLLDINDNAPQFVETPSSNISLAENIPVGTFILDASATDTDLGRNGEVNYSLTSSVSSLPFSIDSSTGTVTTTATLDREEVDLYVIIITASDNGSNQLSTSFTVNVTVTDVNDNAPVFLGEPYGVSIPEDASTDGGGSIDLLTVFATDRDIGTNAQVTYSLAPDTNSRFSIRSSTGGLRVSGGINFEEETEFNVTVIARDMGVPSLTSAAIVRVTIINVDEFAPVFLGPCDANISEARNVSRTSNPVTQCIAVDQDSGSVNYDIVTESNNPALTTFLLDRTSAELYLVQSLDREVLDTYQFTMQASSGGSLVTEMLVTIRVEDVNDNAPVFSPDQLDITYSDPESRDIATLSASDADINENGEFSVRISRVEALNNLTHEITIIAEDMGTPSMTGTASVVVTNTFPCQVMEFSLEPSTLQLSVATLCSLVDPPESQNFVLGTEVTLDGTAVSNLPVTYQWQLNGSFITNPSNNPILNLSRIDFDDIGSYSCIARASVGSIQSDTAFIGIYTLPFIVQPPENNAIETGRLVFLSCVSNGIPKPNVTFFHNSNNVQLDNRVTQQGDFLVITSAVDSDSGQYFCRAENTAGVAQSALATLIVFSNAQLVTTNVLINNPSEDGTCHNLDVEMIEELLEQTTGYSAEVTDVAVTNPETDSFCNSGPCYPNPCANDGKCVRNQNATGGYECTCPDTYTGKNCDIDIDECASEDPCVAGSCINTIGLFTCSCPDGTRGHRCQYQVRCDNDSLCTDGATCVETLVNLDGYICDSTPDNMAATITLNNGVTSEQLDEAVYDLSTALSLLATMSTRKRQLQATSSDACEPRFVPVDNSPMSFKLIWACSNGTAPPSSLREEELICTSLLDIKIISSCFYSNGESAMRTVPTLDPIEVTVTVIMLDPVSTAPLSAQDAVKVLGDTKSVAALQDAGIEASKFTAADMNNQNGGSSSDNGGLSGGAVAGIVIALLIVAILATVGAIAALYYGRVYYKRHATYGINENKTSVTLQRNIESGRDRTQTVVGVFENPTFRRSSETPVTDDYGKDLTLTNPAYQDVPTITKLDGNTKVIDKSSINRI